MKSNGTPARRNGRPPRATGARRVVHDLSNTLNALRLRLDLVSSDSTCMWAQGSNIEAINRILEEARALTGRLENAWPVGPAPRRPSR